MRDQEIIKKQFCQICGSAGDDVDLRVAVLVRPAVGALIQRDIGKFDENGWICVDDLQKYRHKYFEEILATERGEITVLEQEVLESLKNQETLSKNPDEQYDIKLAIGERMADRIADFGGSWTFISIFAVVICLWMIINSYVLAAKPFDPYPYILLNLVLSCLAAIQAPVIMMSQNRQEARDREHAMHDYQVNLKAELEIRHLHQKIDHLMSHQWERLLEIQNVQLELIDEIRGGKNR